MNRSEARELAGRCCDLLSAGDVEEALAQLRPVVADRTPFTLLDLIGRMIAGTATTNPAGFTALLDGLAARASGEQTTPPADGAQSCYLPAG